MRRIDLIKATAWAIVLCFATGCAGSPIAVSRLSPEQLTQEHSATLCNAWFYNRSPQIRAELDRRGAVSRWDWIERGSMWLTMTPVELQCSKGRPSNVISYNDYRGNIQVFEYYDYSAFASGLIVRIEDGAATNITQY